MYRSQLKLYVPVNYVWFSGGVAFDMGNFNTKGSKFYTFLCHHLDKSKPPHQRIVIKYCVPWKVSEEGGLEGILNSSYIPALKHPPL